MHTQILTVKSVETSWQCICAMRILYYFFVNAAMKPNLEWKKGEKIGIHITSHACSEPGQLQLEGEPQQLLLSSRAWQCGQGRGERRFSWRRGGKQDESLWHLLQLTETNSKDQRSSFPFPGYINMFFIQVRSCRTKESHLPHSPSHSRSSWTSSLGSLSCLVTPGNPLPARFSGRDTNLRLCTVPVLISYRSQEVPLFFAFNYSFCQALLKLTNELLKHLLWVTAETQTTWQLLRAWLP